MHGVPAPPSVPSNTAAHAIAVYRAIAESLYVTTTKRVVAVAATSLDSACDATRCGDLAARWGVETLWWATGDSSEARSSRTDLLSRATRPFDLSPVVRGRSMLLEADAGDVPAADAEVGGLAYHNYALTRPPVARAQPCLLRRRNSTFVYLAMSFS